MTKKIVFRGDDAGSCSSANSAFFQLVDSGVLRNVSVMACGPAFEEAAERLRGIKGIAIGLHTALNSEWTTLKWGPVLPANKVPSLVDSDGYFWSSPLESSQRGAVLEEMFEEITAHLSRLRDHGLEVVYIDEHMGVSWPWPELRQRISEFAKKESLLDAATVPFQNDPQEMNPLASFENLNAYLESLSEGNHLLVAHPNWLDSGVTLGLDIKDVFTERDIERKTLGDSRVLPKLESLGIETVRYTDLL